ncbi:MAG: dTDP-4-dehydrorhamnose 3,5-epimerase [Candidatus Nitrohelix vancouverensis]|uniref:dTDP-4-dehydrorhamnose 3,5-epimerase n=1 Tax=Candidatus Nitrohelix vancouverensis TaxID=2705534 RepID=A0A7T0G371_9BACT|nr:MAG: dTDP-4-dehydrorhamnose 3,5-epimerase [Candidatus Nitrohelix vancouverensis]
MKQIATTLDGVLLIEPRIFKDSRGHLYESFSKRKYEALGIMDDFVQDNHSYSRKNVLRGLHFQIDKPQAKLVRVVRGEVFDVAVDIRKDSPNFGKWFGARISAENQLQMYIPKDFAHGFCVLSEEAEFLYKCSDYYSPGGEGGIVWNDPEIGIDWPIENPVLSEKDLEFPLLKDL